MRQLDLKQFVRAGRRLDFTWRYLFNFGPTLAYQFSRPALSGEAANVLADLNRNGVAMTSVERLLEGNSLYQELVTTVDELEAHLEDRISAERTNADDESAVGQKSFNLELLGGHPVLDPDSVYARFALQRQILQIANAYFGMYTRLRYYNVWRTFASRGRARESQLWHRDREDFKILKLFAYLSDIDESAGPFTYAAGSHLKGRALREPQYFVEGGVKRSYDSQMAEVVPPERWIKGVGPKGTIVFADTSGYHKGGLARERDRLMYLCMFTSQSSQSKELFRRCGEMAVPQDKELAFALTT